MLWQLSRWECLCALTADTVRTMMRIHSTASGPDGLLVNVVNPHTHTQICLEGWFSQYNIRKNIRIGLYITYTVDLFYSLILHSAYIHFPHLNIAPVCLQSEWFIKPLVASTCPQWREGWELPGGWSGTIYKSDHLIPFRTAFCTSGLMATHQGENDAICRKTMPCWREKKKSYN